MTATLEARASRLKMPVWPLVCVVCAAGALTVAILGTRLTFFNDDWYFLLQRPGLESHGGLDTLLAPHNGNLVVLLALLYKVLVAVFGMGSQLPFRVIIAVNTAALGALVYVMVSRRLGYAIGLAAATVVVFMGPAWEDFLFFGAMLDIGASLALGLGALVAMDTDSPRRNALACGLLAASVLFSNAGIPFLIGAVILIAARRRPQDLWIPAVPALLFALWWAFYGSKGPGYVTAHNIEHLPRYVVDSASSGLATVTGLNHGTVDAVLARGHILAAICAVVVLVWLLAGGRPGRRALAVGGTLLGFWLLTGASFIPGRAPSASRYQLIGGTLLIVLGAELVGDALRGRVARPIGGAWPERLARPWRSAKAPGVARPSGPFVAVVCIAAALVTASNIDALIRGGYDFFKQQSQYTKTDLGALEIAGRRAPPAFWLTALVARNPYLSGVTAGHYFAQTQTHGSVPYYTASQISSAPAAQRQAADSVLSSAYGMRPAVTPIGANARCPLLTAGADRPGPALAIRAPGTLLTNRTTVPLVVGVFRFAPASLPVFIGFLGPRASAVLPVRRDSVSLPWRLTLLTPPRYPVGTVSVCSA